MSRPEVAFLFPTDIIHFYFASLKGSEVRENGWEEMAGLAPNSRRSWFRNKPFTTLSWNLWSLGMDGRSLGSTDQTLLYSKKFLICGILKFYLRGEKWNWKKK